MTRRSIVALMGMGLLSAGCVGRILREGAGAVMGASGRVVSIQKPTGLSRYAGATVEEIRVSSGLRIPPAMPSYLRTEFAKACRECGLSEGAPRLVVRGEVVQYEAGEAVDTATGPLQEVIVRTQLIDAETQRVVGEANLIGRAKSSSASGAGKLAEGAGKAMEKWLKDNGLR